MDPMDVKPTPQQLKREPMSSRAVASLITIPADDDESKSQSQSQSQSQSRQSQGQGQGAEQVVYEPSGADFDQSESTLPAADQAADPIVKAFDVVLTRSLDGTLYLVQFPLRSPLNNFDQQQPQVRFKPRNQKLEFVSAIARGQYYDPNRGSALAKSANEGVKLAHDGVLAAGAAGPSAGATGGAAGGLSASAAAAATVSARAAFGSDTVAAHAAFTTSSYTTTAQQVDTGKAEAKRPFPFNQIDRSILSSTTVPIRAHNMICYTRGGSIYTHQTSGILQMRPNLDYMDMVVAAEKAEIAETAADEDGNDGLSAASSAAGASAMDAGQAAGDEVVQVKFARKESEKALQARKRSHAYLQAQLEEESWKPMTYYNTTSDVASSAWDRFFDVAADPDKLPLSALQLETRDYLGLLSPVHQQGTQFSAGPVARGVSSNSSLSDRVFSILVNAQILSTDQLFELLGVTDERAIIAAAEPCAGLVRGNWIVKSDLLFSGQTHSATTDTSVKQLIRCRDCVLHLFTTKRVVTRKEILELVKIQTEDLTEILHGIAQPRQHEGYYLKNPDQEDFMSRHSHLVFKHMQMWEALRHQSQLGNVKRDEDKPAVKEEVLAPYAPLEPPSGNNMNEQLNSFMTDVLKHYGVVTHSLIVEALNAARSVMPEKNYLSQVSENDLRQALVRHCVSFGSMGKLVAKSSGDPKLDRFRDAFIRFAGDKTQFKRSDALTAIKLAAGEDPPTAAYNKITKEFAYSKANSWVLKTGSLMDSAAPSAP
ncbi:hypothetical protein CAOG_04960 [Capsaspora owczarzaki ATCC 30864]|uniref:Sin-like protein conserved region-domain-containing protein n=1 Tax=Capsaspora owczarzaki (strain ATCC 30864) TaxID=595528 RepID=A0A0D2WSA7_CAPO3|nr:hypothetical protein CAOG_04960 [Capsaspora owczarzaki ATCC 30864]KJE94293.1 hypothetical protein CAOG_004960 [Capsaspora owczarzaki ATCC 30864]|eukprot:XP_004346645.1 hypothetical protein CAOG_04960 [Capsaspora owczarzaki ATCC 30864]